MKRETEREAAGLIAQLGVEFKKVREKAEFLKLKQSELRPDDWISQTMFRDAEAELRTEQSLLAGHAHMVEQALGCRKNALTAELRHILLEIRKQGQLL